MQNNDIKIYKEVIKSKTDKNITVTSIAKKFGISRNAVYKKIRKISLGNSKKVTSCINQSRLKCLWEHRYKILLETIPKDRKIESVKMLKNLIKDMNNDGFNPHHISKLINKDHSTILHHLEK